jgi:hypothetical protein
VRVPEARGLRRCQSIWKSQSFFKHKVLGWLMLHQGLAVKTGVQKVDVTIVACTLYGRMKQLNMSLGDARLQRLLGHGFKLNLTILILPRFLGKVLSLETAANLYGKQFSCPLLDFYGNKSVRLLFKRNPPL